MTTPGTTTVRVRIIVEVSLGAAWGADCTTGQAHAQGMSAARGALEKALATDQRLRVLNVAGVDLVIHCGDKP